MPKVFESVWFQKQIKVVYVTVSAKPSRKSPPARPQVLEVARIYPISQLIQWPFVRVPLPNLAA